MAAVTCKYHTQTPARWRCNSCQINFCLACIKAPAGRVPQCPVCKQELTSLGSGNLIKPFWARLREFFLYPLSPAPLTVMLVLSAIAFLLWHIPGWGIDIKIAVFPVPRNLIFALPFGFVFLKYAQSVLHDTAHGYLKPRPLSPEQLTENGMIVVKLLILYFMYQAIIIAFLVMFGRIASQIAEYVLLFITPAAIMVLAMEDKLLKVLDPDTVGSVIWRIGAPYILLLVVIYPLGMARNTLIELLVGMVSPTLGMTIIVFIYMYFFLILANMMGYLLYQHHEELGFDIEVEIDGLPDSDHKSQDLEVSPEMRAVEILMHEGRSEEAARQLADLIRNAPSNIEARERMLKLLRLMGDVSRHLEQGQNYISFLFGENKISQAARVFQACYEFDKEFKPQKPGERLELGKYLRQSNSPKLAMALLNNLHKDFPSYEYIPQAYLLVAQMLCEQFNEDARARQVLSFILENYPSHPMREAVQDYLRIVDDVSSH